MWSEVLDDDAYAWFTEHGGLTRANGQRLRDMILSRGGTDDVGVIYRKFRGRDPEVGPLLVQRGAGKRSKDAAIEAPSAYSTGPRFAGETSPVIADASAVHRGPRSSCSYSWPTRYGTATTTTCGLSQNAVRWQRAA